ncbi:unnamed protein product [Brachionus calyciflorus]|uniref:Uncharacterized protein n=1 Tax=Brachionus calyciflorus TaxID=104777 RepID=A0A814LML2_9BILA|nr:unnamed protein product [Brachionus calyciflorus]
MANEADLEQINEAILEALSNIENCCRRKGFTEESIKNFKNLRKGIVEILIKVNVVSDTVKEWVEELDKFASESQSEEIRNKAIKVFKILKNKKQLIDYKLYTLESKVDDTKQENEETDKTDDEIKHETYSPKKTQTISQSESEILSKMALLNKNIRIETLRNSSQNVRGWF